MSSDCAIRRGRRSVHCATWTALKKSTIHATKRSLKRLWTNVPKQSFNSRRISLFMILHKARNFTKLWRRKLRNWRNAIKLLMTFLSLFLLLIHILRYTWLRSSLACSPIKASKIYSRLLVESKMTYLRTLREIKYDEVLRQSSLDHCVGIMKLLISYLRLSTRKSASSWLLWMLGTVVQCPMTRRISTKLNLLKDVRDYIQSVKNQKTLTN